MVVVGTLLDPLTATRSEQLIEAFQTYRQVEVQRGDFQASYFLMFVLVTLLILLASSWMGLFLARRLVAPLQALGEAFRQVSLGDLEQRIEVPADDEMKEVVDSFHRMTDELRASRAALEASNSDLTQANRALDAERAQIAAILENLAAGVIALDAELRVVSCVAGGTTNRSIAEQLHLSGHTVDAHLKHVYLKLDIHSRVELTVLALQHRVG